jgi:hypothetical protein
MHFSTGSKVVDARLVALEERLAKQSALLGKKIADEQSLAQRLKEKSALQAQLAAKMQQQEK